MKITGRLKEINESRRQPAKQEGAQNTVEKVSK